jgi:hypothetical protein
MMNWLRMLLRELFAAAGLFARVVVGGAPLDGEEDDRLTVALAMLPTLLLICAALAWLSFRPRIRVPAPPPLHPEEVARLPAPPRLPLTQPVRDLPSRFPRRTHLPAAGEGATSLSIHKVAFDPERDLVRVEDPRAWWESEHDKNDNEDDHVMHRSMEEPLRRLIELVSKEGGTLKIQDCYRDEGVHSSKSLHKQGRAADLTCDDLGLERLAKLAWAAGFDWVYYEAPKRGGHHVHASVRP